MSTGPKPAPIQKPASDQPMVESRLAMEYSAAVQDCLVQFHHLSRETAAERVMDLWRRLANLSSQVTAENRSGETQESFADIVYHEEPWNIACDLAEHEIPLDDKNREVYEKILQENHLT